MKAKNTKDIESASNLLGHHHVGSGGVDKRGGIYMLFGITPTRARQFLIRAFRSRGL